MNPSFWLRRRSVRCPQVTKGYFAYHAVPTNLAALEVQLLAVYGVQMDNLHLGVPSLSIKSNCWAHDGSWRFF